MALCILTIHGIGFERPPDDAGGVPGYADQLHTNLLHAYAASDPGTVILGNDPNRLPAGVRGPVYVESLWPPDGTSPPSRAAGLSRLDDPTPLADNNAPVAHVALVYSSLEAPWAQDPGPHIGASIETLGKVTVAFGRYATVPGFVRMIARIVRGLRQHAPPDGQPPSLRPRTDVRPTARRGLLPRRATGGGLADVVRALEDDVATYVVRNDLRERVRGFVHDALFRLTARADVSGIIVNLHSQGTVVGYDVLRTLPRVTAGRITGIVTAGSPLRKYTDLFAWGNEAGTVAEIGPWAGMQADRPKGPWINFYDLADPVADPLAPDRLWRRGMDLATCADTNGLYIRTDPVTGMSYRLPIEDIEVNNIAHSPDGSLRAHNYWDNTAEVIPALAAFVKARV